MAGGEEGFSYDDLNFPKWGMIQGAVDRNMF
jgi:hypothetical protein